MNKIYYSGRSSDYIAPSFITGCSSLCSYCYVHRRGFDIKERNIDTVIKQIDEYKLDREIQKPNQTHEKYITWDLGCDSDISRDYNTHRIEIEKLFDYFIEHPNYFGTFATKTMNKRLIEYSANKKLRMRISLMPEIVSNFLEKKVSPISKRIEFIDKALNSEFEIHYNFSPVVVFPEWLKYWEELLTSIPPLPCEVIFLTHNQRFHNWNLNNGFKEQEERLLWKPELQEEKVSSYGSKNLRYKREYKNIWVNQLRDLLESLNYQIRYIF